MDKEYDFSKGKRGPVIDPTGKTRITIMLDDDVIAYFRDKAEAQGTGYQTMINAALRDAIDNPDKRNKDNQPLTVAGLRKVLREELERFRLRGGHRLGGCAHAIQQSRLFVLLLVPVIHARQGLFGGMQSEYGPFGENIQVGVGQKRRNFKNNVRFGV